VGKGRMENSRIEKISLDMANHWSVHKHLEETNDMSGALIAFDWKRYNDELYLSEINTNIDLGELESKNFEYDTFLDFLKEHKYTYVLGLRNVESGPSDEWIDKLKKSLTSNSIIDYDEYVVQQWPVPIPKLETPPNVFILRYCFDTNNKIDELAANKNSFTKYMSESRFNEYHEEFVHIHGIGYPATSKQIEFDWTTLDEKKRVIVLCSNVKNIILHKEYER
jgi:hypothetical protein|tara:strand:- start:154 stop:822 length:669 start_codon:yes stop_codon:yes gene_type:complete